MSDIMLFLSFAPVMRATYDPLGLFKDKTHTSLARKIKNVCLLNNE